MSPSQPSNHLSAGRHHLTTRVQRSAIAVAIAAGIATGSAVSLISPGPTPDVTAQMRAAATTVVASHVGATSASFVHRIRALEAAGYRDVLCEVHGELLFNPRRHRYVTVRA